MYIILSALYKKHLKMLSKSLKKSEKYGINHHKTKERGLVTFPIQLFSDRH